MIVILLFGCTKEYTFWLPRFLSECTIVTTCTEPSICVESLSLLYGGVASDCHTDTSVEIGVTDTYFKESVSDIKYSVKALVLLQSYLFYMTN